MSAAANTLPARSLRVLQLGSPAGLYGAERWILALVKYLPADRVTSTVGVIQDDEDNVRSALCEHAASLGIPVVQFHAAGRVNWNAVRQLRAWLKQNEIDVVHTHGYKTDIVGLLAVRGTRCRIVSTPHGWSTEDGALLQIYEVLDRLAFSFMDAVVPLSPELLAGLQSWPIPARKLQLIPNGVDIDEVQSTVAAARGANIRADAFNVGYIGRLVPQKGLSTLLRGFAGADIPGKRLQLVGEGPQRLELERLTAELNIDGLVTFFGYRSDRLSLLSAFDVFSLCSAREGCPRALLEAMAAGVAVVASDVPGCRDLVRQESNGLLFPFDDADALSRQLERLAADAKLRRRLVTTATEYVEQNYSARKMAALYTTLYSQLVVAQQSSRRNPLIRKSGDT